MRTRLRQVIPTALYRPILGAWRRRMKSPMPASGLSGLEPISGIWGLDRGTPVEIHYIEDFLRRHASDIRGRAFEVGDDRYIRRFGAGRVARADVLNLTAGNPHATIVGDLESGEGIPTGTFDCMIVTNTLLLIYDVRAAIATCHRALAPGGVLLAHFTGIARRATNDEPWGPPGWTGEADYWRFTPASARRLCEEHFGPGNVEISAYGNLRSATAWLYGLAREDLTERELEARDPRFDVVICARAVKRA